MYLEDSNKLNRNEILFLASVIREVGAIATSEIGITKETIFYKFIVYDSKLEKYNYIEGSFDRTLMEEYYNRPCKFIEEVL